MKNSLPSGKADALSEACRRYQNPRGQWAVSKRLPLDLAGQCVSQVENKSAWALR